LFASRGMMALVDEHGGHATDSTGSGHDPTVEAENDTYISSLITSLPELRLENVLPSTFVPAGVRRTRLLVAAAVVGVLAGILLFLLGDQLGLGQAASGWAGVSLCGFAMIFFFVGAFRNIEDPENPDAPGNHLGQAEDLALGTEEGRTSRLILQYHDMVKRQANSAHRSTQVAMLTCLVVLIAGAAVAIRSGSSSTQMVVGGLAALGGTLSAYLSATFMSAYNRTLAQLNYFFGQPLSTVTCWPPNG
jgi:TRADD-N domain-containing protein